VSSGRSLSIWSINRTKRELRGSSFIKDNGYPCEMRIVKGLKLKAFGLLLIAYMNS
jgi:hypothetical protein